MGRDQKQHVEIARDIAIAFNHHFGEVFVVPQPVIREEVATIPGSDGRKMSKSYGNTLPLFVGAKDLRKAILRIVTDSTPMEEPKNPDACTVFSLYRLFATPEQTTHLAGRYRSGGLGYGHAKLELFEVMEAALAGPRARYGEFMAAPDHLDEVLRVGAEKARKVARNTTLRALSATGLKRGLTVPPE